jgi:N-acetylneuraminic acid mutarotase
MPTGRIGHAVAAGLDGRIYAIGGTNFSGVLGTLEAYTPATDTWTTLQPMPTPRSFLAAATGSDGRVYVLGGGAKNVCNILESYSPDTDTWTSLQPMLVTRYGHAVAFGPKNWLYVIGGWRNLAESSADLADTVDAYTPTANGWRNVQTLLPRAYHAAATAPDGRIYAIGGIREKVLDSVDGYTATSNGWHSFQPMPTPRAYLAAAASSDGLIYAIGGVKPGALSAAVELFDPNA